MTPTPFGSFLKIHPTWYSHPSLSSEYHSTVINYRAEKAVEKFVEVLTYSQHRAVQEKLQQNERIIALKDCNRLEYFGIFILIREIIKFEIKIILLQRIEAERSIWEGLLSSQVGFLRSRRQSFTFGHSTSSSGSPTLDNQGILGVIVPWGRSERSS